jgi:hypothetical protein
MHDDDPDTLRRALLLVPLLAALPALLPEVEASTLDPTQTIIRPRESLVWQPSHNAPPRSVEACPLFGSTEASGLYYTLIRWWPGYMSAPHRYATDRLCVIVSGTWWCNSGGDFDPANCVPVPAGSFVRRVAHTWHYDGVIRNHPEPVVIAICGIGPVHLELSEPAKPLVREV